MPLGVANGWRRGDHGARAFEADAIHGLAEQLAVLGHVDGGSASADHLDAELLEDAGAL
jgi:hypothetical protein